MFKINYIKKDCEYCKEGISIPNFKRHIKTCSKNPINVKICPVCKTTFSKGGKTCSYSCSNTFFRSGLNNPNIKENSYRILCFETHGKKCIICGEEKIVAVHHINENHNDNRLENIVPLCPTHHQYCHSRYKNEIQPLIENFIKKYQGVA